MIENNFVLCLHGEHPDAEAMDREQVFVRKTLPDIVSNFPGLRIVLEHISTKVGIDAVLAGPPTLAGTITAHHLELTHTDVIGGMLQPHLFCKPIAKWEEDRMALLAAATGGNPKFFFGSDSAPHPRNKKECAEGCAGVFSAPVLLPVLATIFEAQNALDKLEPFVSQFGAGFYGLPLNDRKVFLAREDWQVPAEYDGIVPYRAGETLTWKVIE
jgi:dihydroorotase